MLAWAGYSGVGIIVVDGDRVAEAGAEVPPWLLAGIRPRGQQIDRLEAVAAACARLTFPNVLRGRRVLHLIDTAVALSKTVMRSRHCYVGASPMRRHVGRRLLVRGGSESREHLQPAEPRCGYVRCGGARCYGALAHPSAPGEGCREVAFPSAAELDDSGVMLE